MTNQIFATAAETGFSRRRLIRLGLGLGLACVGAAALNITPGFTPEAAAQTVPAAAQRIADHFSSVRSMTGEFVQFGPRVSRPGASSFWNAPEKSVSTMTGPPNSA